MNHSPSEWFSLYNNNFVFLREVHLVAAHRLTADDTPLPLLIRLDTAIHRWASVQGYHFFFQKKQKRLLDQLFCSSAAFRIYAGNAKSLFPHGAHLLAGFYAPQSANLHCSGKSPHQNHWHGPKPLRYRQLSFTQNGRGGCSMRLKISHLVSTQVYWTSPPLTQGPFCAAPPWLA